MYMRVWQTIVLPGIILLVLDGIFLSYNRATFKLQVADVQHTALQLKPFGAIACYALLIFALHYFIIRERKSVLDAVLLGIVIYGVYETTTYALLKNWRIQTMILDTVWGGTLLGLTTYFTYQLTPSTH
jgi:uncharacterized membrane protein